MNGQRKSVRRGWYAVAPRILQTLSWLPTRLLLHAFCRFDVRGAKHLSGLPHAIFAVNHSSELDPILLTAALNPFGRFAPMFYVTSPAREYADIKYGWRRYLYRMDLFFKAWGAYPTKPGHKNYETSLENHIALLRDQRSVCIFPEGGVTRDGKLQQGHGGVAFLSHRTGTPVVPTAISGSHRMNRKRFFDRRYRITIRFGAPILPKEAAAADDVAGHAQVHTARIMDAIGRQLEPKLPPNGADHD